MSGAVYCYYTKAIHLMLYVLLDSLRCRYTLRGHTDAVNSIQFLPFSNILLTSSADKTLSLWDARTVGVAGT